jgi:copper oxidase (laccase) domain-containing protein
VHAGWRGLQAGILKNLKEVLKTPEWAFIGPHIKKQSFEVGLDVAEKLASSLPESFPSPVSAHADPAKRYVDLEAVARAHLRSSFPALYPQAIDVDTFSDPRFASYRRGKGGAERQLSFVVFN